MLRELLQWSAHVVRRLLRIGHTVHAPVRSLDEDKIGFLQAMPGASDRLKLFKVTGLMEAGAYDESIGLRCSAPCCIPIFMVGSKENPETKLFGPALQGVENVLASRSKAPKKVILTGTCSAAGLYAVEKIRTDGGRVDGMRPMIFLTYILNYFRKNGQKRSRPNSPNGNW